MYIEPEEIEDNILDLGKEFPIQRIFPFSLENNNIIKNILSIHNKNHTPINWYNNLDFNRNSYLYIKEFNSLNNTITLDGEILENNLSSKNDRNVYELSNNNNESYVLFNFVQKWGYGYYHFICEILPKILLLIDNISNDIFKNVKIKLLLYFNDTFILNTLQSIPNISNYVEIIPYNFNYDYRLINIKLYQVTPTIFGNPSRECIQLIRKYLVHHKAQTASYCIIIKRKETDRSISNFDDMVQNIKKQYPNENWIIFDSDTMLNTIQLFNNAKLVIGMHGAGLSNIVLQIKIFLY